MKIPLSWIKDFVEITLPLEDLAHLLTMAGLEVEEIRYVGLPLPEMNSGSERRLDTKVTGLEWAPDKFVVAEVREVGPHPNADRLVLCRLYDGEREHTVLTGAPNLYPYKGQGEINPPLKVAYARQGARLYDGHQPGQVLTTLKPAKIRGVESYSMIASEKELGISDEHEGVILLDADAPTGMPLVDYMGDAVLEISIAPNIARDANVLGVAREIAALTNQPLRSPSYEVQVAGESLEGKAQLKVEEPELNPRFVLGLIRNVTVGESPYRIQRRLRLAGMRPINNIVDATNYAMLEIGEPLHAFDYDVLVERAGGQAPTIITRRAQPGETLKTLDGVERKQDPFTVLVTDTAGPLSIAGVMGGEESEVSAGTRNVLLEGAAWNFINIRRTVFSQRLNSEAAYRFSRGVHPAMAERGVRRCLEYMRLFTGGEVAPGLIDAYPLPPHDPVVDVTPKDVKRWLGIELSPEEIANILYRLEFAVEIHGEIVRAKTPDHRLDIGEGITGVADVMEEIARIYGYERIPETRLADVLPPQAGNPSLEKEEELRNVLAGLGLQEIVTYRMTTPEREVRSLPPQQAPDPGAYLRLVNPISSDRTVMRRSLLASVLEVVERNARLRERIAVFEVGPVYLEDPNSDLPEERPLLVMVLSGPRELPSWKGASQEWMDFYDLKGIVDAMLDGLHLGEASYEPDTHPSFHPGKCARVLVGGREVGLIGELNPLVSQQYDFSEAPVLGGEFQLEALLEGISKRYPVRSVAAFPPALEDLAVIVDEQRPAGQVAEVIRQAGGSTLTGLELFDVYRGEQIGAGKKSLAYRLTYQAPDHTLTDKEISQVRQRIIRRLESELDAKLRS